MSRTTARRLTLTVVISLFVYALACYSPISWSPEGKYVAFVQYADDEKDKDKMLAELWVVDVASGAGERIAIGEAGLSAPAWSSDGNRIAYICTDAEAAPENPDKATSLKAALAVYDLKTKEAKKLCDTFVPSETNRNELIISTSQLQPSWSPEGKMIAFASYEKVERPVVMTVDLSGQTKILLENARDPEWSPDGQWIACVTNLGGEEAKVVAIKADGSATQPMAPFSLGKKDLDFVETAGWTRLAWAPNGKEVAFTCMGGPEPKEHIIYVANLEGKATKVASAAVGEDKDGALNRALSSPVWSKDGKSIAYIRFEEDEKEKPGWSSIVLLDVATGKEKILSRTHVGNGRDVSNLSWSPDGNWIAYRWCAMVVKLLRTDGSEEKALTADPTSLFALADIAAKSAGGAWDAEEYAKSRQHAKEGIARADEFLRRFPDHCHGGDVALDKARCLRLLNRPQEAADVLDSISLKKPDVKAEQQAQLELAECHVALGQYPDALAIWGGLAELYGEEDTGKQAKKRVEEIEQALGDAQKLAKELENKKSPAGYFELGDVYYETLLDPAKATEALQALLKEFPDSEEAKKAKDLDLLKKIEEKFAKD